MFRLEILLVQPIYGLPRGNMDGNEDTLNVLAWICAREERRETKALRNEVASLTSKVSKLLSVYNPALLPPSPPRPTTDESNHRKRKRPEVDESVESVSNNVSGSNNVQVEEPVEEVASVEEAPVAKVPAKNVQQERRVGIASNYNGVDADQQHGGTGINDIIVDAYEADQFQPDVLFIPDRLKRPHRFTDNAKYNYCIELFKAAVNDDLKLRLLNPNLTYDEKIDLGRDIANVSLDYLCRLEGKDRTSKMTFGYTGVGSRVSTIKKKWPNLKIEKKKGQTTLKLVPKNKKNKAGDEEAVDLT